MRCTGEKSSIENFFFFLIFSFFFQIECIIYWALLSVPPHGNYKITTYIHVVVSVFYFGMLFIHQHKKKNPVTIDFLFVVYSRLCLNDWRCNVHTSVTLSLWMLFTVVAALLQFLDGPCISARLHLTCKRTSLSSHHFVQPVQGVRKEGRKKVTSTCDNAAT